MSGLLDVDEYAAMARAEERHWWYLALRDLLGRSLERAGLPEHPRVLDAGCGSGGNLAFLADRLRPAYLGGFDTSAEALRLAGARGISADLYASDIRAPVVHVDELDLVTSLDVLYIPGAEAALEGLRELVARLKIGGLLVLNLPAYRWLYSEHDVALHTRERFTARRVRVLLQMLGLSVELLSYRLCFLFPELVLSRLPSMLRARRDMETARSELREIPGARLNRLLLGVMKAENRLISRGVTLPWGSSVFAVGRRVARSGGVPQCRSSRSR